LSSKLGREIYLAENATISPGAVRISLIFCVACAVFIVIAHYLLVFTFGVYPNAFKDFRMVLFVQLSCDAVIALSYFVIPCALVTLVTKRRDIPFNAAFVLFAAFIISCGFTHIMLLYVPFMAQAPDIEAGQAVAFAVGAHHMTTWSFRFLVINTVGKIFTAFISFATALVMVKWLPLVVQLATPTQMRHAARAKLQALYMKLKAAKIQQQYVAKNEFISMLSHEIRTPLNACQGTV
jgi:signal transduction histidine kinase